MEINFLLEILLTILSIISITTLFYIYMRLLRKIRQEKIQPLIKLIETYLQKEGIEKEEVPDLLTSLIDSTRNDKIAALVRISGSIEMTAISIIEQKDNLNYVAKRFLPIQSVFDELLRREMINKTTHDAFHMFMNIRNKVIHGREITEKELDGAIYLGINIIISLLERERSLKTKKSNFE